MAISVATANANRIIRGDKGESFFQSGKSAVTSSSTWFQGELLCLDSSGHYLRPVAATGDAASLAGVSDNQVVSGQLNSPYAGLTPVNAAQVTPDFVGPKVGVIAGLTLKTGDAFTVGAPVYLADGTNSSTVSITDPGDHNYIGIFQGPAVSSATAGQIGAILVGARIGVGTGLALSYAAC